MRPHKAGTRLYRPGQPVEIVVAGVSPAELEPARSGPARWAGRAVPDGWTRHERFKAKMDAKWIAGLDIESAILRRIGLLTSTGAYSIESWRSPHSRRIVVELLLEDLIPEQAQSVRDEMTSMHLAPRLHLDNYRPLRTEEGEATIELSLPHTGETAQVRLAILPRTTNAEGRRLRTLVERARPASTRRGGAA